MTRKQYRYIKAAKAYIKWFIIWAILFAAIGFVWKLDLENEIAECKIYNPNCGFWYIWHSID